MNELGHIDHRWVQTDYVQIQDPLDIKIKQRKNAFTQKPDRKEKEQMNDSSVFPISG